MMNASDKELIGKIRKNTLKGNLKKVFMIDLDNSYVRASKLSLSVELL